MSNKQLNNNVTKELNTFLKGNFMAIHAYDKYIYRIEDDHIKKILQEIQQDHKQHASIIAERIQNLGDLPVDDAGMMGNAAELFNDMKNPSNYTVHILKDALVGEHRGIEKSKELLDGDLDPESRKIVKRILNVDQKHVELLNELIQ